MSRRPRFGAGEQNLSYFKNEITQRHCGHHPLLVLALPQGPDFAGAGRHRTPVETARVEAERYRDRKTARILAAGGIDPWLKDGEVTAVDLATLGERVERRGRPLRRLCVFNETVSREQRAAYGLMAAYDAANPGGEVIHLRLRPKDRPEVSVFTLRSHHQAKAKLVTRHLDHVARSTGGAVVPLAYGVHHRPVTGSGGAFIDLHFHVAVEVQEGAIPKRTMAFLGKHYDAWQPEEDPHEPAPAAALATYCRKGIARHLDEFTDDYLCEYVRQMHSPTGLHRWQSLGPLRRLAGELRVQGVRPTVVMDDDEDERVVLTPIKARPAYRPALDRPAGPSLLAMRLSWIDGELRPALLVRNWAGDWEDLARRYDLDGAVEAARRALGQGTYTFSTAIPEFFPDPVVTRPIPPSRPPPPAGGSRSECSGEIPW